MLSLERPVEINIPTPETPPTIEATSFDFKDRLRDRPLNAYNYWVDPFTTQLDVEVPPKPLITDPTPEQLEAMPGFQALMKSHQRSR